LDRQKHLEPVRAFLSSQTFASPQQRTDRDVVEARLRNLEAERAALGVELESSRGALALLLEGSDEAVDLDWQPMELGTAPAPEIEKVLAGNPGLAQAGIRTAQADAQMTLAEKEALPDPE